jgi:hypothetical protein
VPIRGGFKFFELALDNSPEETMVIIYNAGLQITVGKGGPKITRRKHGSKHND